jgi:hypothetical protein
LAELTARGQADLALEVKRHALRLGAPVAGELKHG